MADDRIVDWLLAGDAAIRWQTLRDLAGASERTWKREQRKIASHGWGARLLALQDADGRWAGGVYTRSHRTGKVAKDEFTRLHFPPRWHYDVLRGLDYFRAANAPLDARLEDAIELVGARRQAGGMWPLARGYPGKVFFEMEETGQPSRWNTLRALRVLRWAGLPYTVL